MYNILMNNTLPISQVRNDLSTLVENVASLSQTIFITVKGKVKAALISAEELELLNETMEILSDPITMKAIEDSRADIKTGRTIPWSKIKAELET